MKYAFAAIVVFAFAGCATTSGGSFSQTNLDITVPLPNNSSVRATLAPVVGTSPVCSKAAALTVNTPQTGPISCNVIVPISEPSVTVGYPCE